MKIFKKVRRAALSFLYVETGEGADAYGRIDSGPGVV